MSLKTFFLGILLLIFSLNAVGQEDKLRSRVLDKKGNLVQRNRLNFNGVLENDINGIGIIKYEYDRKGNLIKKSYFDKNDKPFQPDTTSRELPEFPCFTLYKYEKENLLEVSNHNANGAFMDLQNHAAVKKMRYNHFNQLMEEYNFDKKGKLRGVGSFEIAMVKYTYLKNQLIEKRSFDKNKKVLNFGLNIAKYSYDSLNRMSRVSYFFANSDLYLTDLYFYNSSNQIIKEEAYRKDGKLDYTLSYTYDKDQVVKREYKYFNGTSKVEKHGIELDLPGWKMLSLPHIEEIKDINGIGGFLITVDKTGKIVEVKKSFGDNALMYAFLPYLKEIKLLKDDKVAQTYKGVIKVGILNPDQLVEEY
jgi:hypothetical protein